MQVLITVVVLVLALVAVIFFGTRMVRQHDGGPSSGGNAFGGFDVFDPGKERAERDLDAMEHQIVVTPRAGDGPMHVDVDRNSVRIRRPAPGPAVDPTSDEPGPEESQRTPPAGD